MSIIVGDILMEFFQILSGLSEGQNAENIERLQKQLNGLTEAFNNNTRLGMQTDIEIMVIVIIAIVLFSGLFLWSNSLAKRVKRLESALPQKRAD